jgi:hypothetical protein
MWFSVLMATFSVSIGLFIPFIVLVAIWVKVPFFPITIDLFDE